MRPGVLHNLRHQIVGINELTGSVEGWFAGESAAYGTFRYGIGSLPDQWLIERPYHGCARRRQSSVRNLWNREGTSCETITEQHRDAPKGPQCVLNGRGRAGKIGGIPNGLGIG